MVIEYICTECDHSVLDVVVIPLCKCPNCSALMESYEWEGLPDNNE